MPAVAPTTVCGSSAAVIASTTATSGFVYLQFVNQSAEFYGIDVSGHSLLAQTTDTAASPRPAC